MEEVRKRLANEIAARLAGAAESDAKSEMIEELAENLTHRYEDMTAAGIGTEDAFAQALDELGDPAELVAYLNGLDQDEQPGPSGDRDEIDAFFQGVSDLVRDAAGVGRQAARAAGELLKTASEAVRDGTRVYVHVDGDGWMDRQVLAENIRTLDVGTMNGDVDIFLSAGASDAIRIEGNVDKLDISVTDQGVLTVRERSTASGQFFSFRGLTSADVSLTIPARRWESIRVATVSGDVDMGDDLDLDRLEVRTVSGDLDCRVRSCGVMRFKSARGDMDCAGNVQRLEAETARGEIELRGPMGEVSAVTASGDVDLDGSLVRARVKSMSGDITVTSMTLPMGLDLSSKSGDVDVRIPDTGPFAVRLDTVSGEARYGFPRRWEAGPDVPQYTLSSISGDVTIKAV